MKLDHEQNRDRATSRWSWRSWGIVTTGQGMAAGNDGPIEITVMAILGAFIGLMIGLMAANMSRFFSMFGSRQVGGMAWGAYGAAAGALLFAVLALTGGGP